MDGWMGELDARWEEDVGELERALKWARTDVIIVSYNSIGRVLYIHHAYRYGALRCVWTVLCSVYRTYSTVQYSVVTYGTLNRWIP